MAERIEVGYAPAAFVGGLGFYHKYILYTNSAGQQFYARGGPGIINEPGTIVTENGEYNKYSRDWDADGTHPRETIIEGDDLSAKWYDIKTAMKDIDARDIEFEQGMF